MAIVHYTGYTEAFCFSGFFFFSNDSKHLLSALSGAIVRYTFCYSNFTDKETEVSKIK